MLLMLLFPRGLPTHRLLKPGYLEYTQVSSLLTARVLEAEDARGNAK